MLRNRLSLSWALWLTLCIGFLSCSKEDDQLLLDTTPPDAISDLTAESGVAPGTVRLQWTATGDDGMVGTAHHYEVRYSAAPIDAASFDAATEYVQNWGPLPPMTSETRLILFLNPGDTLYFAVRVYDEAGNASEISNVDDAYVTQPDVTPPETIDDLAAATGVTTGSVILTWTAPGDDGATGTADAYDVRFAVSLIDGTNFQQAVQYSHSLTPKTAGSTETMVVVGLVPNQTYYFAVRSSDDSSNLSGVSNSPSAQAAGGTDAWANLPPTQVPSPRSSHTGIWCGSELIIWGGLDANNNYYNDGYRFDPSTQRWSAITTTAAPSLRANHQGVWTGKEMIVWGGDTGNTAGSFLSTGSKYTPTLDKWQTMSTLNAPSGRRFHKAVWTGTEMIMWGGANGPNAATYLSDGGRYEPSTNSWRTLPAGGPSARIFHSMVWTGSELIVWGGESSSGYRNDGARYDPSTDTWTAMATPPAAVLPISHRSRCATVWTGTEMIVWGGVGGTTSFAILSDGARYNPSTDTWSSISQNGACPQARYFPEAAWTGSQMLVWGGLDATYQLINDGGAYNLAQDTWSTVPTQGAPCPRWWPSSTWTGTHMVIWGGFDSVSFFSDGAMYDPVGGAWSPTLGLSARSLMSTCLAGTEAFFWGGYDGATYLRSGGLYDPGQNRWRAVPIDGAPTARSYATAVYTAGAPTGQIVIWGGNDGVQSLLSGGRYTPSTGAWSAVNNTVVSGHPKARYAHTAVWTGSRMIVWGGNVDSITLLADGEIYDPATDTWTGVNGFGEPSARSGHIAVWTGTYMVIWGGYDGANFLDTGGRYDPSGDQWLGVAPAPASNARTLHTAVWDGTEVLIWGGADATGALNTGLRYNPTSNSWSTMTAPGAFLPGRYYHSAAWSGSEMIIWGGGGTGIFQSGGKYDPSTDTWVATTSSNAPAARYQHGSVWTGTGLVVWGGYDGFGYLNDGRMYFP
jgi:N-acetylneuraminic acid mutarotase